MQGYGCTLRVDEHSRKVQYRTAFGIFRWREFDFSTIAVAIQKSKKSLATLRAAKTVREAMPRFPVSGNGVIVVRPQTRKERAMRQVALLLDAAANPAF